MYVRVSRCECHNVGSKGAHQTIELERSLKEADKETSMMKSSPLCQLISIDILLFEINVFFNSVSISDNGTLNGIISRSDLVLHRFLAKYIYTAQKMKFSIKDFLNKRDQICRKSRIWSHLLKKSLMENFFFVRC